MMKTVVKILFFVSLLPNFHWADIVVVHSQTGNVPACPVDSDTELWEGYSFVGLSLEAGIRAGQKLGSPGSCLKQFFGLPFLECESGECTFGKHGNEAMWLARVRYNDALPSRDGNTQLSWVSRCAVCETNYEYLVRHSMNSQVLSCPTGWESSWTGYSFFGSSIGSRRDAGQDMGDTGSCLPYFVPEPIVKCWKSGSSTECDYGFNDFHGWMVNLDSASDHSLKGNNFTDASRNIHRIGRCTVCRKAVPD